MAAHGKTVCAMAVAMLALVVCVCAEETSPMPESKSLSGVEGTISLGPTHGGPIRVGVPSSKPLANAEFIVLQAERTIASFKTDEQGAFRVALAPGHYVVAMKEEKRGIGRYGPFEVDVDPGRFSKVEWHCDTGMR